MRAKTFKGGVHLHYFKEATASKNIEIMPEPERVTLPVSQHLGAPAELIVAVGDQVKAGQIIAQANGFVSVPVHASISGKVTAVNELPHPNGKNATMVVIENDHSGATVFSPKSNLAELSAEQIRDLMLQIGLVGMGGAGFPTHVKYQPVDGKRVDTVILNGAECEPYLTCDHRLMVEKSEKVILGLQAMMKAAGVDQAYIGIEVNKPDAIEVMTSAAAVDSRIQVVPLEVKYPQGEEKMLINATTKRTVPTGGLPIDVGVVVDNIATAVALAKGIQEGIPLISRVVTVTGAVNNPRNLSVKLGTSISELIDYCNGFSGTPGRIILGGPMTGPAQYRLDLPVIKTTSGVLIQERGEIQLLEDSTCVRCARCVDVCPYNMIPCFVAEAIEVNDLALAEKYGIMDCRECGSCTFVCPARRPIVQDVKTAKAKIMAAKKKQ
ncbi:MAG: electron transport complex subunit RsxC [Firmicutes bacterium]|nr:electron transport complex subunit RsxC [Bacillota bacterium]